MTRRGVGAITGGVVALVAILAFLLRSRPDDPTPAAPVAHATRSVSPPPPPPAPLPDPPPPAPAEPVPEAPPAPVPDEDALVGRVVSAAGAPVAGAEVTTLAERVIRTETGADGRDTEERTVTTGDDGRFRVSPLRRDLRHALRIRAAGHGHLAIDLDPPAEGPGERNIGDLTLPAARSIHGLARETSGKPLAKATVLLRAEPIGRNPAVRRDSFLEWRERTDDDGRFRFQDLAPGRYTARLEAEGWHAVEATVTVPAERDPDGIELLVESGRRLVLVFVDESGAPVEGQFVSNRGPGALLSLSPLRSDADGRVEFRGLPRRAMRFTTHIGLAPGELPRFAPEEIGPLVPDGQEIRVVLHPLAFVRGRVVDEQDRPLHGLQIDPWEGDRWLYSLTANSGRDGQFEIAVAAGRSLDLRVEGHRSWLDGDYVKSEFTMWRGRLGPVDSPAEGLVLRCRRPPADRTLRIRVTDADGAPVRGALVDWHDETLHTVETDGDGVARCERMFAVKVRISCRMPPAAPRPEGHLAPASIEVVPEGQQVEMPYRRGAAFTVVVRDPAGAGLAGAEIRCDAPGSSVHFRSGRTDLAGTCTLTIEEGLEIDELHVLWRNPEGRSTHTTRFLVDTRSDPLVVVLEPRR